MSNYPLFYRLLANNLIALTTTNFVWFALTFWAIVETRSVIVAAFIAGVFAVTNMLGAMFFGAFVDHHHKKTAMAVSSATSLAAFSIGALLYLLAPTGSFDAATDPLLWVLVAILMIGSVTGNMRMIALSTSVTILFTENRDKANGLIGATQGFTFAITSILSGIVIGFFNLGTALMIAIGATLAALLHLHTITYPETVASHDENGVRKRVDVRGTIALIWSIPGLTALIAFTVFNNFLGGVFMALMDIYGLSLVSVATWGTLWGVLSLAMIFGSGLVARYGTGRSPLRTILIVNVISWGTCMIFPLQPSIYFLAFGMFVWLFTFPFAEAAEQTVLQEIVPLERQGRVIGFGQSLEAAVTPITTFFIGPIAQLVFIPFMTTGAGVMLIGDWFGTGEARGIALVFITAGFIGLIVTLIAWYSRPFRYLAQHHEEVRQALHT
jgi:MFS transporter, DHA3 family, multidrug efflux protein